MCAVLGLKTGKHLIGRLGRTARFARSDLGAQRFQTKLTVLLALFEQAKSGTHDLAHIVEPAALHLVADKCLEMIAEGDAGRHDAS
ncbi:hypothetical protein BC427_16445 [Ralstonia solanacearum FJAT-91]|nr:hypothetical protein BC427_16445 [Ralstonia solanacearum FJAT-91]